MKEKAYSIDVVHCDWITATTWEKKDMETLADYMIEEAFTFDAKPRDAARMQYKGRAITMGDGGLFVGEGVQNDIAHYMVQASGEAAHRLLMYMVDVELDMKVTRIDFQYTKWETWNSQRYDSKQAALRAKHGNKLGRRVLRLVEGGKGFDTLYVGSRKSGRVVRYYVKDKKGILAANRLEIEFKGAAAESVYASIVLGDMEKPSFLLQAESDALGLGWKISEGGRIDKVSYRKETSLDGTYDWVLNIVQPSLIRLARGHDDYGRRVVRAMAEFLIKVCDDAEGGEQC
ncbi:MAG: hypothetical protein D6706_00230 [Chloroflexi bacterium]|nr:MAG: hypothetical protein D6706_00230 [Chloroflexota bacterium]